VPDPASVRTGLMYALACYGTWGVVAVFFKQIAHQPGAVVLAHRIIWSMVFCAVLLTLSRRWSYFHELVRSRRAWAVLSVSAVLVAVNWLVFIHAVSTGRVLQSSLGYFMNPLVSIVLGTVLLGERLRAVQWAAAGLAACGVGYLTLREGLPWIAVTIAITFGLYGLVRKTARPGPLAGLMLETTLLCPLALGYLAWRAGEGLGASLIDDGWTDRWLLVAAGVVTSVPLLWFAAAAKRLRLSTLGFMQYISPSLQFVVGLAYGETFNADRGVAFGLIWAGVGLFVWNAWRGATASPRP
jgi:chloramphenicol-sensitive protein RarD